MPAEVSGRWRRAPASTSPVSAGASSVQVQPAGHRVEQRRAEQRDRGGHDADHEEGDRRRRALHRLPAHADQHVQRQGQRLQRDDQRDQVAGRAQHDTAGHRAGEEEAVLAGRRHPGPQQRHRQRQRRPRVSSREDAPRSGRTRPLTTYEHAVRQAERRAVAAGTDERSRPPRSPARHRSPPPSVTGAARHEQVGQQHQRRRCPRPGSAGSSATWSTACVTASPPRSGTAPAPRTGRAPPRAPGRPAGPARPAATRRPARCR